MSPDKNISFYISKISKASNRYDDKLLRMMDLYNVNNLAVLTLEQVKYYYEKYIEKGDNHYESCMY